jgi:dihydrofolate synthase / folylpolyglutamate synthase
MLSYQQAIEYLFNNLPMFQRIGAAAYKKDLTNITALCSKLENPQDKFHSIHIAGTNGKGSTTHLLAAYYQSVGMKVGVFTSPHYKDFRERMKINGEYIPEQDVLDFVVQYKDAFDEIQPSFFEMTTAMAFWYFAKEKVDLAIIETGLGGRLDSTNIIKPILSVITNISYDHMQFLGETLPEIAGEKAGIIKQNTPVIIGETQDETTAIFVAKAKEMNAEIVFAEDFIKAELVASDFEQSVYDVFKNGHSWLPKLEVGLYGNYQQKNIVTALTAIDFSSCKLEPFTPASCKFAGTDNVHARLQLVRKISPLSVQVCNLHTAMRKFGNSELYQGFKHIKSLTKIMGRWEVLGKKPLILAESAHNEAGIKNMFEQIKSIPYQKLHIVYGMVNDKDIQKALSKFPNNAKYYFCKPDIPRGLEVDVLLENANEMGYDGTGHISVKSALGAAKNVANEDDLILIGGSIFVVAEVI